jgi:hypothetical protein
MWTSLGPLQEFVNLNQLDGIGTTVRNYLYLCDPGCDGVCKTLDIIFAIQVAMEYVCFTTHRSTVYVSWLCRLDWKFVTQIHSVFQWLCYD